MLLRPLLHLRPILLQRFLARPALQAYNFSSTSFKSRKMSSADAPAPAPVEGQAAPKVTGEQPNLQLDKETGEMVSKSSVLSLISVLARRGAEAREM